MRRALLIQGMKLSMWAIKYREESGRFWKWVTLKSRNLKIGGMSGDTYLFRRSPSIDRLGRDCPKLTQIWTFEMSWESMGRGRWVWWVGLGGTWYFELILGYYVYFAKFMESGYVHVSQILW